MDDIRSLIEELRFGAENGADAELLERAADKIQELVADLGDADAMTEYWMKKNKWIRCEDRLPELTEQVEGDDYLVDYSKDVLVYVNGDPMFTRNIQVGRYQIDSCGGKGFTDEMFEPIHNVTHWMPLPDAPEVEG